MLVSDSCNVNQTSVGDSQNLIGFGREEDFSHVDEGRNSPDYASDSEEINQQERSLNSISVSYQKSFIFSPI